ncbi:MAG: isocitrate/isopropylmalate dehydrogenase family protein [Candidatus Altiarchaeota archaeon]
MSHRITLIPGDGIGPEITDAAVKCIEATGVSVDWDVQEAGTKACESEGKPLPDSVVDSIMENKVALKAPVTTPIGKGFRSVNVELRQKLDLYACVRPCKTYEGVKSRYDGVDLIVVRENTEGLYAGIEFDAGGSDVKELAAFVKDKTGREIRDGSAVSLKPISEYCSRRIADFAFDYAVKNNRTKVTAVTKANIMKYSDGLFMKTAEKVAGSYDIKYEHRLVDAVCMQLVQDPRQFDVLVMPNLYGDIVSDLCAGLVGGLGVAPGANIGGDYAVFEATHGSAPDIAGKGIANPTGLILSGVLMLKHIGEGDAAVRLEDAVAKVLSIGENVTPDLNPVTGKSTGDMADAVIGSL